MNQSEYIKLITQLFNKPYKKYKNINGFVDKAFFNSQELKINVQQRSANTFEVFGYPALTTIDFDNIYTHALRQFRHLNKRDINKSYMVEKDSNSSWVTEEVQEKLGWSISLSNIPAITGPSIH